MPWLAACDDADTKPWTAPPTEIPEDRDVGDDDPTDAVSYSRDVRPIFQQCALCHHSGGIIGYDFENPFDAKSGIIERPNSWREAHDSPY